MDRSARHCPSHEKRAMPLLQPPHPVASEVGQIYSSAGRRILRFMRYAPSLKSVVAEFLHHAPSPTREASRALGMRLQCICHAWRRDVPERMYHAILRDAFVVQSFQDDSARELVRCAGHLLAVLRTFVCDGSDHGSVSAAAQLRANLDEALQSYLLEHTAFHLRREAALVSAVSSKAKRKRGSATYAAAIEAELERCYGQEILAWASRISVRSSEQTSISSRARLWHAALLDRNFEMIYSAAPQQQQQQPGRPRGDRSSSRGSPESPVKVSAPLTSTLLLADSYLRSILPAEAHMPVLLSSRFATPPSLPESESELFMTMFWNQKNFQA